MHCLARLAAWWLEQVVGTVLGHPAMTRREYARVVAVIDEETPPNTSSGYDARSCPRSPPAD